MKCIRSVYLLFVLGMGRQMVNYVYPLDNENIIFEFDFSSCIRYHIFRTEPHTAGIQRTAECSCQSAGSSSYNVIKGGGMWCGNI